MKSEKCGCGRPSTHSGRCVWRRANPGPRSRAAGARREPTARAKGAAQRATVDSQGGGAPKRSPAVPVRPPAELVAAEHFHVGFHGEPAAASLELQLVRDPEDVAYPYRVQCFSRNGVGKTSGILALLADEREAAETLRFNVDAALEKGWNRGQAPRVRLLDGVPAPPRDEGAEA